MAAFCYHDLSRTARRHKYIIPVTILGFVVAAFLWLNIATPRYTTIMIVGPTTQSTIGKTTQTDTKEATTEINDEETVTDFARFIQLLSSPEVAAPLLQDKTLNVETNLLTRSGITFGIKKLLYAVAGQKLQATNDATTLAEILSRDIHIDAIGRSTMRKISMRHADRDFAIRFLNTLYQQADAHLRETARERNLSEITYLRAALNRVTITEQRKTLTDVLAMREQTQILLAADVPYAADQIQKAEAPTNPDWPPVGLTLFFALCLGAFTGFSLLYLLAIREWLNASR